jgi:hypothetical protein
MTATPAAPARRQSPALEASTPPIATTGIETSRQISASPSSPIAGSASGLEGVAQTGPAPMYAPPLRSPPERFGDRGRGSAQQQPGQDRTVGTFVSAAKVDTVRSEPKRCIDVVVHNEESVELDEALARLD